MGAACWCAVCDEGRRKAEFDKTGDWAAYISRFMIVCPDCGNKRCPRANHHREPCTGSNEPGQHGSAYPAQRLVPSSPKKDNPDEH